MPNKSLMNLKILLPFGVFSSESGLSSIVVETSVGSLGILPRRMDCIATLCPGILVYKTGEGHEVYVAVDGGIMVKYGFEVLVSVRNAVSGMDIATLQETVEREFIALDQSEQKLRLVLSKMESAFIHNIDAFSHV